MDSVSTTGSIYSYWWKCRRKFDKTQRREVDGILIYFWWNIRKERRREIEGFSNRNLSAQDKWLLFAKMRSHSIVWQWHRCLKGLKLIEDLGTLNSFPSVVVVPSFRLPGTSILCHRLTAGCSGSLRLHVLNLSWPTYTVPAVLT